MAALIFPTTPTVGQRYPVDPGTAGISQWQWDGAKWNTVLNTVSLGATNQDAFNSYLWPNADGTAGYQLTTDGAGSLTWDVTGTNSLVAVGINAGAPFDGIAVTFPLVLLNTTTPYAPNPSTNIIVYLGGVPQTPISTYTVAGSNITFATPPLTGTSFYAASTVVV
jgi:hypothetical protein